MAIPTERGFRGPVIGGPMAGKFYEGKSGRRHIEQMPAYVRAFDHRGQPEKTELPRESMEYVFGEPFGVGMWFPRGWTQDQVMEEIIRNYRPAVVERESVMTF